MGRKVSRPKQDRQTLYGEFKSAKKSLDKKKGEK